LKKQKVGLPTKKSKSNHIETQGSTYLERVGAEVRLGGRRDGPVTKEAILKIKKCGVNLGGCLEQFQIKPLCDALKVEKFGGKRRKTPVGTTQRAGVRRHREVDVPGGGLVLAQRRC